MAYSNVEESQRRWQSAPGAFTEGEWKEYQRKKEEYERLEAKARKRLGLSTA